MVTLSEEKRRGVFDVRYRAFLETVTHTRADLHRYCARMTGSVFDGEDVVQEALFEAYGKIETLAEPSALRSWLFSIAHNRCIDFLRRQRARSRAEKQFAEDDGSMLPVEPSGRAVRRAVEQLVINLPAKQRACGTIGRVIVALAVGQQWSSAPDDLNHCERHDEWVRTKGRQVCCWPITYFAAPHQLSRFRDKADIQPDL
jgi:RNA polymerase sigma factor (sigma-70 family)